MITTMFTLFPSSILFWFGRLITLNFSENLCNEIDYGIINIFKFTNNKDNGISLSSYLGINMFFIIIIFISKVFSKWIDIQDRVYVNIVIRDNFTSALFAPVILSLIYIFVRETDSIFIFLIIILTLIILQLRLLILIKINCIIITQYTLKLLFSFVMITFKNNCIYFSWDTNKYFKVVYKKYILLRRYK